MGVHEPIDRALALSRSLPIIGIGHGLRARGRRVCACHGSERCHREHDQPSDATSNATGSKFMVSPPESHRLGAACGARRHARHHALRPKHSEPHGDHAQARCAIDRNHPPNVVTQTESSNHEDNVPDGSRLPVSSESGPRRSSSDSAILLRLRPAFAKPVHLRCSRRKTEFTTSTSHTMPGPRVVGIDMRRL